MLKMILKMNTFDILFVLAGFWGEVIEACLCAWLLRMADSALGSLPSFLFVGQ